MTPLIDIIIPMHNSEQYIKDCLLSVKEQEYKNLHVILVDDGSDDQSVKVARSFAKKIKLKITLIVHEESLGVSKSRNDGLNITEGEYVTFVDSDDMILPNHVSLLVGAILNGDNQLAVTENYHASTAIQNLSIANKQTILTRKRMFKEILGFRQVQGYPWNKLFDISIIRHNGIRFDERLFICEDLDFVCRYCLSMENRCMSTNTVTYFYRINKEGALASRSKGGNDILKKGLNELLAYDKLVSEFKRDPFAGKYIIIKKVWVMNNLIYECLKFGLINKSDPLVITYNKLIKRYFIKVLLVNFVPLKAKVSFFVRYVSNFVKLRRI